LSGTTCVPELEKILADQLDRRITASPNEKTPVLVFQQSSGPRFFEDAEVTATLEKLVKKHEWVCLVVLRYTSKEIPAEDFSRYPCTQFVRILYSTTKGLLHCQQNTDSLLSLKKLINSSSISGGKKK